MSRIRWLHTVSVAMFVSASLSGCEVLSDPAFIQGMTGIGQNAGQLHECQKAAAAANDGRAMAACFNQYDQNTSAIISQVQ